MPRIRIDERLADLEMPSLRVCNEWTLAENDALVICGGFEERADYSLGRANIARGTTVVAISYLPFMQVNRFEVIISALESRRVKVIKTIFDRKHPSGFGVEVSEILKTISGRIFLDVSAMSRLLIVQLLVATGRIRPKCDISVLYTEAQRYHPNFNEVEKALAVEEPQPISFLSSGVYDVAVVPELSSTVLYGQPIRLITFPTFDSTQLTCLRSELQPATFTLISGFPPAHQNTWRPDAIKKINKVGSIPNVSECITSTLEYTDTLRCLLNQYAEHSVFERLVLAPTGSKMQTVASGIFRLFMTDVQICYPTVTGFNAPNEYTQGAASLYRVDLDAFSAAWPSPF